MSEVPKLNFVLAGKSKRYVMKQLIECNWVQAMEGNLCTSYFSFLHMPASNITTTEYKDPNSQNRHRE